MQLKEDVVRLSPKVYVERLLAIKAKCRETRAKYTAKMIQSYNENHNIFV